MSWNNFIKMIVLYVLILLVQLAFVSYGGVSDFNKNLSQGFMTNIYEMWKPDFGFASCYSSIWNYILITPYLFLMFYFIRHVKVISFEMCIVLTFSFVYGLIYANWSHREVLMPILILWFTNTIKTDYTLYNLTKVYGSFYKKKEGLKNYESYR